MKTVILLFSISTLFFFSCSPSSSSSPATASCPTSDVGYAVDTANNLLCFSLTTPATIAASTAISGLAVSENIVGLDFRVNDGTLYALGSTGQLYTLNISSGAATAVGTPIVYTSATSFGFDFNPVVDRIRVSTNNTLNSRLNPDTGVSVATDTALNYAGGDPNVGATPAVTAVAYTNNASGAVTLVNIIAGGAAIRAFSVGL